MTKANQGNIACRRSRTRGRTQSNKSHAETVVRKLPLAKVPKLVFVDKIK